MNKKKIFKYLKYFIVSVLALNVIISVGLLSLAGLLLITPLVFVGMAAFVLAGGFEGDAYGRMIFSGIGEVQYLGSEGFRELLLKKLDEYAEDQGNQDNCGFLKIYFEQRKYVLGFKDKELNEEQKIEKKAAAKRLRRMQEFFIEQVLETDKKLNKEKPTAFKGKKLELKPLLSESSPLPQISNFPALNRFLGEKIRAKTLSGFKTRLLLFRCSVPFILLASLGSGFATASAMQTALLTLSLKFGFALSAAALSAMIWPIVVFAAVGYVFLILHTAYGILFNESLHKWYRKAAHLCHWQEKDDSLLRYRLRVFAVVAISSAVIILAVLATFATAGTWWYLVQLGVRLVPYISPAADILRNILTPAVGLTQLFFNIKNSLKTVKKLFKNVTFPRPDIYIKNKWKEFKDNWEDLKNRWEELYVYYPRSKVNSFRLIRYILLTHIKFIIKVIENRWAELRKKEHWTQIFNPFRFITKVLLFPFKIFVFIGHVAAIGVTSDRLASINVYIVAGVSTGSELFQDGSFIRAGSILEWFLKVALWPLFVASAVWDYGFSRFNEDQNNVIPSFSAALRKSFGRKEKAKYDSTAEKNKPPVIPREWLREEAHQLILKFQKKYLSTSTESSDMEIQLKLQILRMFENYVLSKINEQSAAYKSFVKCDNFFDIKNNGRTYRSILSQSAPPSFFKKAVNTEPKITKLAKKMQKLVDDSQSINDKALPQFHP